MPNTKYSIIIPNAFDHLEKDLKPCVESVLKYTDLLQTEIIVVNNGVTDLADEYVKCLIELFGEKFKLLSDPKPMGYARATNWGISEAKGEYVVLLNNDAFLLEQPKNQWLDMLEAPFKRDASVGITGPIKGPSAPAGHEFIIFFCAMIKRELIDKLKLNTDYGVGGGEDTEYCIEAEKLGYTTVQVPETPTSDNSHFIVGGFPIYHKGEATMNTLSNWQSIFDLNSLRLAKKYNPEWYKWKISNSCERAVIDSKEDLTRFPREVTRYKNAAANIKKGDKVLEIGCSSGYGLRFFPEGIDYTGVDYDETIIKYAQENFAGPNRKFVHSDIHDFVFNQHYDVIVAYEVIEHLDDGKQIAQELKKHCNKLLISTPYQETPGLWGHHHRIHHITEEDFPDFDYTFVSDDGRLIDKPERFDGMNLLLMKWEKGKTYAPPVATPRSYVGKVLAFVPTKNRYGPLAMTIQSIALQTVVPNHLMIYDDGEGRDLRVDPVFKHVFRLLDTKGINWEVVFGKKQGQHHGHQIANTSGFQYVWRIDDDEVAEPPVLEKLLKLIEDPSVGAVAGAVIVPGEEIPGGTSKIEDIYHTPNIQWSRRNKESEVDHLYSSFLYRAGIVNYDLRLSPVAHREETMFSNSIKEHGYKLLFTPEAVTYHFRNETGGIRDGAKQEFFVHDEVIFNDYLKRRGIKVIRENGGIGDNLIFRRNVLFPLLDKYKKVILGTCFPHIFQSIQDPKLKIVPVGNIPEVPTDNIYAWAAQNKWNKGFGEAYKKFYGVD